jgi:hypothetical protein
MVESVHSDIEVDRTVCEWTGNGGGKHRTVCEWTGNGGGKHEVLICVPSH